MSYQLGSLGTHFRRLCPWGFDLIRTVRLDGGRAGNPARPSRSSVECWGQGERRLPGGTVEGPRPEGSVQGRDGRLSSAEFRAGGEVGAETAHHREENRFSSQPIPGHDFLAVRSQGDKFLGSSCPFSAKWREQYSRPGAEVGDHPCQCPVSCTERACDHLHTPAHRFNLLERRLSCPPQSKSGWSLPQGLCTCHLPICGILSQVLALLSLL